MHFEPLDIFLLFWVFVFGSAVGSFLNVCIWRLPRGLAINNPRRSVCPRCGEAIAWYDNIPLLSFIWLGGRCRHCNGTISWRYPLVEGITGVVFSAIYGWQSIMQGTPVPQLLVMFLVAALLIVASGVDMEFFVIPDEISVFGLAAALLAGLLLPQFHVGMQAHHTLAGLTGILHLDGLIGSTLGALIGGGMVLFFAIFGELIFRREALGFGDVKLMAMVGAFFGWKVAVVAFFISPFFGLVYGLPLLFAKGEHVMPYGPFLSGASLIALIFRENACQFLEPVEQLVKLGLGF
jgi:leader peptidase (prepilin peptidase)/N-methyltransferase